jgi:hypothetical protein
VLSKFVTDKEDPDHPASTHLPSTRGLLTRIGTRGITSQGLERAKEGSTMTQFTMQKIPEDHNVPPPKTQINIFIEIYVK